MLKKIFLNISQHGFVGFSRMILFKLAQPKARCHLKAIARVSQKSGIEIGGPSSLFSDAGLLPLYSEVGSLDNVNFSNQTVWENAIMAGKNFSYHPQKKLGNQFIAEATNLDQIQDETYDFVLTSHTLEHSANPIKVLTEFKRILRPQGALIIIVPHHKWTFDWKRPVTNLAHLIEDHSNSTPESDLTHLEEILKLHDLKRDPAAGTPVEFAARCLQNTTNRCLHQHVFDLQLLTEVLIYAGFEILTCEHRNCHCISLAIKA